jgi:hypothetical protein
MANVWLRLLWFVAATVVRDVPSWLREEENFVGARFHRDNDDAFVNVVWQQGQDGNWTKAIGQWWWDSNDVMKMGGQQYAERLQVLHHLSKATIN